MGTDTPIERGTASSELPDTLELTPRINPHPYLAEARRRNSVQREWPLPMNPALGPVEGGDVVTYSVLGHEEVAAAFRDNETYSSAFINDSIGPLLANTMVAMDEPLHRVHRALVARAFRPKLLAQWENDLVRPVADELIDSFIDANRVDLVPRLAFPLPVRVIARILGLPQPDLQIFQRWSVELISFAVNWRRAMAAFDELRDYFFTLVVQRRRDPQQDLISELIDAEIDGQRLSDEDIFAFLRLLLPAGIETTYRSLGNLLFAVLTHPDQLQQLKNEPSLIPQAVEEGLRWEPPIVNTVRVSTRASRLGGVNIPAGAVLNLLVGSANRDERVFRDPDNFDIHRKAQAQIAFGVGAHACLGMHLARMENRIALEAVLERLDDLRLDPDAPTPEIIGMPLRSPEALHVLFTAAAKG